jgi:hypothetical protein
MWIDQRILKPGEAAEFIGLSYDYIKDLRRRGTFVPAKKGKYSARDIAHVLLLSEAVQTSAHLQRGTYNGANKSVLTNLLAAMDKYLDAVVATNDWPERKFEIARQGDLAKTTFDLRLIASRVLPLRPGGKP